MIYIGIDPGKKGSFGAIGEVGIYVKPWDNVFFIEYCRDIYRAGTKAVACVEKVGAMPGQGVTSMFNFGKSAGFIEGVLQAYGIPYQLITPQKWKKEFSLGHSKEDSITVFLFAVLVFSMKLSMKSERAALKASPSNV